MDDRTFHINCEAEEMVARNPRWTEMYGEGAFDAARGVATRAYDHRVARGADGDTLWAWQSRQEDGNWSIVSFGTVSIDGPMALVMIHRDRSWLMEMSPLLAQHHKTYGQPIRLARFVLDEVEEEPFT